MTLEFTSENFMAEVLESGQTVLVYFYAPWCGPCRMIAPIIDGIANDFAGRVRVGKVNVDDNPGVVADYEISSIPTLLLFRDGNMLSRMPGLRSRDDIAGQLDDVLENVS